MEKFQEQFIGLILPAFERTINKRKEFYNDNPRPSKSDVETIINTSSAENAVRSGILAFAPGPLGLITIIPDLVMSMESQINMIYDIGVAHGKEELMTKETILSLALLSGGGSMGISLLTQQAGKLVVKKAAVKIIQNTAKAVGIKLTAGAVKSSVASYVPLLGGLAIGVWVKYVTDELGRSSESILSKNVSVEETDTLDIKENSTVDPADVVENKILVLLNLMKVDGESGEKEKTYISQIIDKVDLGFVTRTKLQVDLHLDSQSEVNFELLKNASKEDKDSLLIDMLALATRDGKIHNSEFEYIMNVCDQIDLDTRFVIDDLSGNFLAVKYFLKDKVMEVNQMLIADVEGHKVQFYTNNRVFIFNQKNEILKKGTYLMGGRKIVIDGGKTVESKDVLANLKNALT
jgi:uncharacterized tellurite resistance protein B-like protein